MPLIRLIARYTPLLNRLARLVSGPLAVSPNGKTPTLASILQDAKRDDFLEIPDKNHPACKLPIIRSQRIWDEGRQPGTNRGPAVTPVY